MTSSEVMGDWRRRWPLAGAQQSGTHFSSNVSFVISWRQAFLNHILALFWRLVGSFTKVEAAQQVEEPTDNLRGLTCPLCLKHGCVFQRQWHYVLPTLSGSHAELSFLLCGWLSIVFYNPPAWVAAHSQECHLWAWNREFRLLTVRANP